MAIGCVDFDVRVHVGRSAREVRLDLAVAGNDDDRDRRLADYVGRGRPHQPSEGTTEPAAADHEQVGVLGLLNEDLMREAEYGAGPERHLGRQEPSSSKAHVPSGVVGIEVWIESGGLG